MLNRFPIGSAGLLLLSIVLAAQAHVVTITPSKDNTLYQDAAGSLSNGKGAGLFVGQNSSGAFARRALLAFDVSDVIPPGSEIHSVSLTLHVSRTTSGPQEVALHKLTADWGEGDSLAGRGGGGGAPASEDDATWLHRFFDSDMWTTPGGDFAAQPSAAAEVSDVGFYTWGLTPAMVADVQDWLDNPAGNFGWILVGNEGPPRTSKRFSSRESSETTQRPMLTINFTPAAGCREQIASDLNNDCRVDFADLALLAEQWLTDATGPRDMGTIEIDGVGTFEFDPANVTTTRPDIFKPGHFSVFDILVYLDEQGLIDLDFRFVPEMNTHVIDTINGLADWWYVAYYDGGWFENNVFRMDHFPYKDKMFIRILEPENPAMVEAVHTGFGEEVERRQQNDGRVIIPSVVIRGQTFEEQFEDVEVTPHNLRDDTFQDGVITAIDIILSLAGQGKITHDLKWYDSIGSAGVVRSYWVERINADRASGYCGFVYETGMLRFGSANHIHIPSDWRVINSPGYGFWFWIELGPCE